MTMKDVVNLSIPQLEYLLEGCNKNTKEVESSSKQNQEALEGADAIQYLIENGEID